MYDMIGKMTAAQAGRDELISILLEGVATGSGVRRTDGGRSHRMCSRAVRCWGRESAQHRTTSYGLRCGPPAHCIGIPIAQAVTPGWSATRKLSRNGFWDVE